MRRTKKLLAVALFVLFSFTFLFANGINTTKTNALSQTFFPNRKAEHTTIYYFSDSEPSFLDKFNGQSVVVDVHNLLNEQELRYLIFSGYFWGFQSSENADENTFNHIAVIEIKTFKPSVATITNLVNCLRYQHVFVVFSSPFYADYDIYGCYSTPCNFDQYTAYLRNTVRYMEYLDTNNGGSDSTTVFLSDDFLSDFFSAINLSNIDNVILSSPVLRRMLCYYYYGIDLDDGIKYEKEVYSNMWRELFDLNLMQNHFYFADYDFFDNDAYIIEDISIFVNFWEYINSVDSNNTELFSFGTGMFYNDTYKANMYDYYLKVCVLGFDVSAGDEETEGMPSLLNRNFFVYVYVGENLFLDLTVLCPLDELLNFPNQHANIIVWFSNISQHNLVNCSTENGAPSNRFYALGTSTLDFNLSIILWNYWQDFFAGRANPISCSGEVISFDVLIYEEDSIVVSENGYPALSGSDLIELLGAEFDEYPNAEDLFLGLIATLLGQLTII